MLCYVMKVNKNSTIDEAFIPKIKKHAKKLGRSESWIVNEAIKEYLEKNNVK